MFEAQDLPLHVRLSAAPGPRCRPAEQNKSIRIGKHLVDLGYLHPLYGSSFTGRLLDAVACRYASVHSEYVAIRIRSLGRFLKFTASFSLSSNNESCPTTIVYRALLDGRHDAISASTFRDCVEAYTSRVRDLNDRSVLSSPNPLYRKSLIETLSVALQEIAAEGLWPDIGSIKGLNIAITAREATPTFGELVRGTPNNGRINSAGPGSYDRVVALSRRRLVRLRQIAEIELKKEEEKFDLGQELLERQDPPISEILTAVSQVHARYDRGKAGTPLVEKCFPLDDELTRRSSLLRYFRHEYEPGFKVRDLPWRAQVLVHAAGGISGLYAHLEAQPRALIAAWTIVGIDTGLNIQPIDDLPEDPFIGAASRGEITLRTVGGIKNRARGRRVDSHLVERPPSDGDETRVAVKLLGATYSSVDAIRCWQKLRAPMRDDAVRCGVADYLWIYRRGCTMDRRDIRRLDACTWKHQWNYLLEEYADDEEIGGLALQRRMIRSTVSLLQDAAAGGDARVVAKLAQHSSARVTTRYYLNRKYIRRRLDDLIRDFQRLLEARMLPSGGSRAAQIGISEPELRARTERAIDSGLGFACADPWAGAQPDRQSSICTKLEACPTCPLMRFVPSLQSIEALVIFRRSLEAAFDEFAAKNPERWSEVWLPALALATAAQELLAAGPKRRMLDDAIRNAEAALSTGTAQLFRPW